MIGYIAMGNFNIRIHRDITDEMWLKIDRTEPLTLKMAQTTRAGH
jgi:hypothetical protein